MMNVEISTEEIKLDQFLKWANVVSSGGEAKMMIQNEMVRVNGEIVTNRGRKVRAGDILVIAGFDESILVQREK